MLMLYAVTPAEVPIQPLGLRWAESGAVGLLYDERREMPQPKRDEILAYGRTLLDLSRRSPILPIRYGTVVESEDRLRELLDDRADEWRKRLDEVAGHVEMLVHWPAHASDPDAGTDAGTGHSYLMSRVTKARQERDVADELSAALDGLVAEHALLTSTDSCRLACLVPADSVQEFEAAVHEHARTSGRSLWCTGPWPPFSFASEAT